MRLHTNESDILHQDLSLAFWVASIDGEEPKLKSLSFTPCKLKDKAAELSSSCFLMLFHLHFSTTLHQHDTAAEH